MKLAKLTAIVIAMIAFSSCGNDMNDKGSYNPANERVAYDGVHAVKCAKGNTDITYTREFCDFYKKDNSTNGKWTECETLYGVIPVSPVRLCFLDGKLYTPIALYRPECGPTKFGIFLSRYCAATNQNLEAYINREYKIDSENGSVLFNDITFNIVGLTDKELVLNIETSYDSKLNLEVSRYGIDTELNLADSRYLKFESVEEAYRWLIEVTIDTFGESIDMNEGQNDTVYDFPILNIKYLEEELETLKNVL